MSGATPPPADEQLGQAPALDASARLVAALLAIDPGGLGGAVLRAPAHSQRSAWLALLRGLCPDPTPWRRLPLHADTSALLGGLDLGASLSSGRTVAQPGLLAQAHQGWLVLPMAERVPASTAAHLCAVLDTHEVRLEREGLTQCHPAHLALLALDEGTEDEPLPAALLDRLAFQVRLTSEGRSEAGEHWTAQEVSRARQRLAAVTVPDTLLEALCAASLVLGVASLRPPLMALRAARALAALEGAAEVEQAHAQVAVQLVLAPRATRLPAPPQEGDETQADTPPEAQASETEPAPEPLASQEPPPSDPGTRPPEGAEDTAPDDEPPTLGADALQEMLVQAAIAALPPHLLTALQAGLAQAGTAGAGGRAGALQHNLRRGRPVGTRRGELRAGARLHLLDTLRAAAPWQRWRQQAAAALTGQAPPRIRVQREDFHVRQFRQHRPTTTVFVVDASGSSALHRLAEAKGAVELLLAECYVRRDRAAVVAFRGAGAEVLLPPTRSLTRAKRSLAALPGGGGTPLAAGLETAHELARQISRQGETPVVVLLTDGRANLSRSGQPGRAQASEDALAAARQFRLSGLSALLIDTSAQPQAAAQALAQQMGARYLPLPHAGAQGLSMMAQAAAAQARAGHRP